MPISKINFFQPGIYFLLYEMLIFGFENIPIITFMSIVTQIIIHLGTIAKPWNLRDVCISATSIVEQREWKRMITSALVHSDDMHLYYNMVSYLIKGKSLEDKYGSKNFGLLLLSFIILGNLSYILTALFFSVITGNDSYKLVCAVGFSGVVFTLKVLTTFEEPEGKIQLLGVAMPAKLAVWCELLLIHILVPNSSLIGHLSGIILGVFYCASHMGTALDSTITFLTGEPITHGHVALIGECDDEDTDDDWDLS